MPALSLVTGYKVFCVTGEQVPVVRQTVCEWRAIVEDEFVIAVGTGFTVIDRCLEGFVFLPIVEYGFFEFRNCGDALTPLPAASNVLTLG